MHRYRQPSDGRGSLWWIQHFVNERLSTYGFRIACTRTRSTPIASRCTPRT
jgi:hypothetical protein